MALCYKDRAYCSASRLTCFNEECYRFLTEDEEISGVKFGLPFAFMDFSDNCDKIVREENNA